MRLEAPTIIGVCAFLKRNGKWFRPWTRDQLVPFVTWYWRDARVGIIREQGRIVAVALARCVNDVKEADVNYCHDEAGKIIWVDDIVSRHPMGIALLLEQVRQRFGTREAFAGKVFRRDGELRMLPFRIVQRMTTEAINEHQHSGATAAA